MAWASVGTIALGYEWQFLDNVSGELFRLSQTWDLRPIGPALIAQFYEGNQEYYGVRAFYATDLSKILELTTPTLFLTANLPKSLGLKLAERTRVYDFNWQVLVEKFA